MVVSTKKPGSHFKHLRTKNADLWHVSGEKWWKSGGKSEKVAQDIWTNDPSWIPFDLDPENDGFVEIILFASLDTSGFLFS